MAVNGNVKKIHEPMLKHISRFFMELKAEMKRITWASKKETKKTTAAVLTFCVIYMVLISAMDFGFTRLFNQIFK
jgi:preprotein translocase subunit SecE